MRPRAWISIAVALLPAALSVEALAQSVVADSSDVYIQQSRGRIVPGSKVQKPPPETTNGPIQNDGPTAPVTCTAQNAQSSQACYTATQQARPATR